MYSAEVGFTKVIQILTDAKKPIVAQNPQYDIAFLYEQFIAPLPDNFIDFCTEWKKQFPVIYDTKCINIEVDPIKGGKSNLEDLYHKCTSDKSYNNNLAFKFDTAAHAEFGNYDGTY
jgi:hypothetical protein